MTFLVALIALRQDPILRTPAIYRCSTAEGESKFLEPMLRDDYYDQYCIEPKPGPSAKRLVTGRTRLVSGSTIDTPANLSWRNATMQFVKGEISPKAWLAKTQRLRETVHFLSNPRTPTLWNETKQYSPRAVFAEMLILAWPGRPCFTADDVGGARYLPDPGKHRNWILAMNDYLGPMMYMRCDEPAMVTGKPQIVRADAQPGLLVFRQTGTKRSLTFYLNNGPKPLPLPPIDLDQTTVTLGLNIDGPNPLLLPQGFMIVERPR